MANCRVQKNPNISVGYLFSGGGEYQAHSVCIHLYSRLK